MKSAFWLSLIIVFLSATAIFAQLRNDDAAKTCEGRVNEVVKLLAAAADQQGVSASTSNLISAIRDDFIKLDAGLQNQCREPLIGEADSERAALQELEEEIERQYPHYTAQQLKEKAAEKLPMYKKGDYVKIRYKKGKNKSVEIRGTFTRTQNGNIVLDNRTRIKLNDLDDIAENEGMFGERAKFDDKLNASYRRQWIHEYEAKASAGRKNFESENREKYLEERIAKDQITNIKNGYTYWHDQWYNIDELLRENAQSFISKLENERERMHQRQVAIRTASIEAQLSLGSSINAITPHNSFPSVAQILKGEAVLPSEQARLDALAQQQREEQLLEEREKEEARLKEERAKRDAERARKAAAEKDAQQIVLKKKPDYVLYGLTAFALIGIIAGAGWWYYRRRAEERNLAVERFFANKGKLQQEFWAAADADPDHFKYVAYLFDNEEDARDALLKLSFISMNNVGELQCRRNDIEFGTYEHQGRAVAFIGGTELNYARWREASMTWPELPSANYFRQSTEPVVKLELPNIVESGGEIENLGSEDVRLDTGEINRVFRFKTSTREKAIEFLNKFNIDEEGIMVQITTDEGEFGKDINGIFENQA